MFTHVMVGAKDKAEALKFYDAVLGALGHKSNSERPNMYSADGGTFMVREPRDGKAATHANGGTIGFKAPTRKAIDAFHKAALANGGTCEGPPGPRDFGPNAYAAYVRDPTGNKICAICYAPA